MAPRGDRQPLALPSVIKSKAKCVAELTSHYNIVEANVTNLRALTMQNYVFVIDDNHQPLNPIHPKRARRLLDLGKAAVFRMFPFTIILKTVVSNPAIAPCTIKIDPGSKTTGFALLQGDEVIWAMNLEHRGHLIKSKLDSRRAVRRGRRNRNTRYRQPRFLNRTRPKGWLAPSLMHRVLTTETWVKRLIKFAPVQDIKVERVKFDTQLMENPEISGKEYQQGTLAGYTVREYLLEKWGRECTYCGKTNVPLQVEHIHPKSKGGSDRVSNLCIACQKCNQRKGDKPVEEFLKRKPSLLTKIKNKAKRPLKDAAAVNATRFKIVEVLSRLLPTSTSTGAQTKMNRTRLQLPKDHWVDAACVGEVEKLVFKTWQPLKVVCKGQGGRQKAALNKYGYPIRHNPLRPIKGWSSGDMAVNLTTGLLGRVSPRSKNNFFSFTVLGQKAENAHVKNLRRVHQKDSFTYSFF